MYFQKMVGKLGHKNENLVAMMTKFPSIRPSFTILGNLVNSESSPTEKGGKVGTLPKEMGGGRYF